MEKPMSGEDTDIPTLLSEDMIFGVRRRERLAWSIAIGGLLAGLGGIAAVLLTLPLKETQAFLAIVDKDTGIAARVVEVAPAGLSDAAAVQEALLFGYVTARETFDEHDNEERILSVWRRSDAQARQSLEALWSDEDETYPPNLYGAGARAEVRILAINPINGTTAQVRFEKILTQPNGAVQTGKFSATVAWTFAPKAEREMKLVWENPLGFTVSSYRVNAETLTPEG
jgi:type IV secretion system protein VirB8